MIIEVRSQIKYGEKNPTERGELVENLVPSNGKYAASF